MANDLYGELLARALQRRAPPGHFPAFVTPGEANLLRSHGGGVAPGGGQYMAGGIPAFFSEADPNPGYGGGAMGFEDFGTLGVPGSQEGPSDMDIALGILGLAGGQAQSPHGHAVGEHGWSFEPTAQEISMAQQTLSQHKAEEEAAAARSAAAMESQFQAKAAAQSKAAAQAQAQAKVDKAQNRIEFEKALTEQIALNPYTGGGTDSGTEAQTAAQSVLDAQAQAAALSIESGFGNLDAQAAAVAATGQDPTAGNVDNQGNITAQGAANIAADIGTNSLAQGRFSPAASWGALSEVAQENIAAGRKSGLTAGMIAALNAQDHQGYAITNPQPTEASIVASQVFAQLNPTITNAVIGLAGFLPGPVGFAATIAGLVEDKGLMNIPAVQSIPGVSAISEGLASARGKIGDVISGITDPITGPVGEALSAGQQAVADALSGILGPQESTGFEDAGDFDGGGVDGGAPDIEIMPPIATETDAAPALSARAFGDVDDETRRRILANIISGLQRAGRPTEGVTAFGPLFT